MARAASQWRGSSMIGAGVSIGPGAETDSVVMVAPLRLTRCRPRPSPQFLRGVISHFELLHRLGRIRRPGRVARTMCDSRRPGQSSAELLPAVISFDLDADGHALNHVSELSRDDVPRHERNCAPVDLFTQTTLPWNGAGKASSVM